MKEAEAGTKTPDDESTAESAIAQPKLPESPPFVAEDLMDFELNEEKLADLWKYLQEDVVTPPASESVKPAGPETGTPLSTIVDADMDVGISVSDLLECADEEKTMIPSEENQPSVSETDDVLLPANQKTDFSATADVSPSDDDELREHVVGKVDLNLAHTDDFEF